MTTALENTQKNIGRNDKCPCGSGKKYKKCCMKIHKLQQEAKKTSRSANDLIDKETSAWSFYKLLRDASAQNLLNFLYDLTAEEGPFRKKHPNAESFFKTISDGELRAFGSEGFQLMRIRHDGDQTLLVLARGLDSKQASHVAFEVFTLKDCGTGLRIWDLETLEKTKNGLAANPSFEDLGIAWSWAK